MNCDPSFYLEKSERISCNFKKIRKQIHSIAYMLSPPLDFSLNLNWKSIWNLAWPHIIIVCQVAERIVETFFVFYYKQKMIQE